MEKADLIVATTQLPPNLTVPAVNAVPYLTGIGAEKVDKEILEKLEITP